MTRPLIIKKWREVENGAKQDNVAEEDPLVAKAKYIWDLLDGNRFNRFNITNFSHYSFIFLIFAFPFHYLLFFLLFFVHFLRAVAEKPVNDIQTTRKMLQKARETRETSFWQITQKMNHFNNIRLGSLE